MRHILHYIKTYPQLLLHSLRLVIEFLVVPVYCIGGAGVVVEGVGWACHSGVLNQSREVFFAQQTEDAIGVTTMTPSIVHNRPRPVQVINKKY
jgi:Na+/H+ antiporter NhaA